VEFPWRLLGPITLCSAMLVAAIGPVLDSFRKWRGAAFAVAMALLIVPNLSHMRGPRTADVDLAFWTPHELAVRGFETTTMGEVTPRWVAAVPPYDPAAARVTSGDAQVREFTRAPFSWSGEVKANTESRLLMSFAYFPGWTARVDGRLVAPGPAPGSGLIEFAVPAGQHEVDVSFGRSAARRLGEALSFLALLVLASVARWSPRWIQ
jgi:hypothetical protein